MQLFNEDCLITLDTIPEKSVDLILCDLPYGVTKSGHDVAIEMVDYIEKTKIHRGSEIVVKYEESEFLEQCFKKGLDYKKAKKEFEENKKEGLWSKYERVIKDNGAIILFGQDKFSAEIMLSNRKNHRYNLIWEKLGQPTGFLNANRMPLRNHEDIMVFYKKLPTYNPQKFVGDKKNNSVGKVVDSTKEINRNYGEFKQKDNSETLGNLKHPRSVLLNDTIVGYYKPHPPIFATQKPVELMQWLIRSYSNEGDTVLDNCMGSGTTGVACALEKRNFIGIEKEEENFLLAEKRIKELK